MATDRRRKNWDWYVTSANNEYLSDQHYRYASLAVLLDIRDELQAIRSRLDCRECMAIPQILRRISANTYEKKQKARKST